MDLNEKIKQILVDKNISPSHFADEIGIQRSSVSHILAGRNKPSLDIVQKVIRRFPELGMNWILDDEDLPEINPITAAVPTDLPKPPPKKVAKDEPLESRRDNIPTKLPVSSNLRDNESQPDITRKIERVMIFYTDGTFQEYKH